MRSKQALIISLGLVFGCTEAESVPERPTWADIEPILNRNCNHCHGSTAATTGSRGSAVYRFDFFDLEDGSCGDAAAAISLPAMALGSAGRMKDSVATVNGVRPRMPPAPAPAMADWERDTLDKWSRAASPPKGSAPRYNRAPSLQLFRFPGKADRNISFSAILSDPDGDAVIGVIRAEDTTVKMDRAGSFAVSIDTTGWPLGRRRLRATLCDGWVNHSFDLGEVEISHVR